MPERKTTADMLNDYNELVAYTLFSVATDPNVSPEGQQVAENLFKDGKWKADVVAQHVRRTQIESAEEREALYGAMRDLGFELPSLLS